jgi:hypothetical protein
MRSFATVSVLTLGAWLLAGCAGTMEADGFNASHRPQLLIPGASRDEVKGLAMGSARAKGWTIVKSTNDLLVVQRQVAPASPTAAALGAVGGAPPPMIEVTSAFTEQSGGINVALRATRGSQPPGGRAPQRVDYTENYRDALTQSLESLRSNWGANGQRVTNAIPPHTDGTQNRVADPANAPADNPLVKVWGETLTETTPANPSATSGPVATPAAPRPSAAPTPPPVASPAPRSPETTRSPAPVIDGSSALTTDSAATRPLTLPEPEPTPAPLAPEDNMLTLSQAGGTGTWAYYAEQYARLRGCTVTDAGSQLIETHSDGEIHKVSCVDSAGYLLKCQNGVCRALK